MSRAFFMPTIVLTMSTILADRLLQWHAEIERDMPWKETKDPYRIWISEVILQQTRVAQGRDYYLRFVERLPTVRDLAMAKEDEVLRLWKGLGYYSRARNLHKAAKQVMEIHAGVFPRKYEDVLSLPGIGPYTAAAIVSFAYDLPYPVVDGNVYRVLSRIYGIHTPIDSTAGKKEYLAKANENINTEKPAQYNQAIMDFGALICKPISPLCTNCIMADSCVAHAEDLITKLPVKEKKTKVRNRYFVYVIMMAEEQIYLQRRDAKDIWQGLYEPYLIELPKRTSKATILTEIQERLGLSTEESIRYRSLTQQLSHQKIHATFVSYERQSDRDLDGRYYPIDQITDYAYPRVVDREIQSILYGDSF